MNIFFLDRDPALAAQSQFNSHVVKMIVETAQLLSTAHHVCGSSLDDLPSLYKPAYKNHPSAVWVRQSLDHYNWLYAHFAALCAEYKYRYGKLHATDVKLSFLLAAIPENVGFGWTDPPQCMPDEFKNTDTVTAYRNYYRHGKRKALHVWKKRARPDWF